MQRHLCRGGQPSLYQQHDGYGGVACDYLWFVQALLNHAQRSLQANKLPRPCMPSGRVDFAYPSAPIDFSAAPRGFGLRRELLACPLLPRFVQVLAGP